MNPDSTALTVPPLVFDPVLRLPANSEQRQPTVEPSGLPMAAVEPPQPHAPMWMGVSTLDRDGRLALAGAIRYLGWHQHSQVTVAAEPSADRIRFTRGGNRTISAAGYLRLPAAIRLACHLAAGERLLIVALPARDVILALTGYTVERLWSNADDGSSAVGAA